MFIFVGLVDKEEEQREITSLTTLLVDLPDSSVLIPHIHHMLYLLHTLGHKG